jgi:WS/DGAT/MGAT family acyltransferase
VAHFQRLSALDAHFLDLEDAGVHMHVGALLIFEAGPLSRAEGSLDFERVRDFVGSQLHRVPRYRQRLARVPLEGHPVWVDDAGFNLLYHVRHVSLPRPGDLCQLMRLVGLLLSQKLDRGKPLWEFWLIEGVQGGRFALVAKAHHCMIDGIAGVDLLATLLQPSPGDGPGAPPPWRPRPAPTPAELLAREALRRAREPLALLGAGARLLRRPGAALASIADSARGIGEALAAGFSAPASPTPLNPSHVGPHRRFDGVRFDLERVKEVKRRLGGTLNDVVLATVAGAVRSFLRGRGLRVGGLDFRVLCPVNIRAESERDRLGNRVVMMVVPLPVSERDPRARLRRVIESTQGLKDSRQMRGAELIEEIADWTATALVTETIRLATRRRAFNLIVTNVPGPPTPLYLLGATLLETYPWAPLYENQALSIALFSYRGGLYCGLNSDWDRVADLHDFAGALGTEFDELAKLAESMP